MHSQKYWEFSILNGQCSANMHLSKESLEIKPFCLVYSNNMNCPAAPRECIPLINNSIIMEQHYCEIFSWKLKKIFKKNEEDQ
mgnify:FL=1